MLDLVIRLFNLVSGAAMGYVSGLAIDSRWTSAFTERSKILQEYLERVDNGDWIPDTNEANEARIRSHSSTTIAADAPKAPDKSAQEPDEEDEDEDDYEIIEVS